MNEQRRRPARTRTNLALALTVALVALAGAPAAAYINFTHAAGFGSTANVQARAYHFAAVGSEFPVVGPRDSGGEGFPSSQDSAAVHVGGTPGGGASVSARASARRGSLGAFVKSDWAEGVNVTNTGDGNVRGHFYDVCTLKSDTLPTGFPVRTALSWKLAGRFSRQTPGINAGNVTLFLQAFDGPVQHASSVVRVSSQAGRFNDRGLFDLPGLAVGDSIIVEPFLHVISGSLPHNFGTQGSFTTDADASVVPVVPRLLGEEGPGPDAHWTCSGMTQSTLDAAQWEVSHCALTPNGALEVPAQELNVAFIPVTYNDTNPRLTLEEVADRVIYLKSYFFQQSMCSVEINPITVRDPNTPDGWFRTTGGKAFYDAIPEDPAMNFARTATIWYDAFRAASVEEPALLVANQTPGGVDAIVVVTTDADIRPRAYITRSLAGRASVIDTLIGLALPTPVNVASDLLLALFQKASVITSDSEAVGNWAHELGHALFTFWDHYATDEPFVRGDVRGAPGGVDWSLMGGATNTPLPPINGYNRQIAGWLKYKDIPADGFGDYALTPLKDMVLGSEILRYRAPKGPTDWYIFERRDGADDGVRRAPEQAHVAGVWDSVVFDGTNTILTDNTPDPKPFWKYRFAAFFQPIRPNMTQPTTLTIVDSDEDSITVSGNVMTSVKAGDRYETAPGTPLGGREGLVIYQKREIDVSRGRTPACGSIHGGLQISLNVLFAHEFGSCLSKINNVNLFPANSQGQPTLLPGTTFKDDQANVEFSLSNDFVLTIKGTAKSRTVVSLEAAASVPAAGAGPASLLPGRDLTLPVDLRLVTDDGRGVGPDYQTGRYELGISGARAGGAYSPSQWISLPDDIRAAYVVDASQAVANARALGIESVDIQTTISIIHYDAEGAEEEVQAPVLITLSLDRSVSAPVAIPTFGARDLLPPVVSASVAPAANEVGWHRTDAVVTIQASDEEGGSGMQEVIVGATGAQPVATTSVPGASASLTIALEGETVVSYSARDTAGNVAEPQALTLRVDKTAPGITIQSPANAAYALNQPVTALYTCTDDGSGVASCGGSVPSGSMVPTGHPGAGSFRVDASDRAGHSATASVAWTVVYNVCGLYDPSKARNAGSTVPIKLQMCDFHGVNVSSPAVPVTALGVVKISTQATGALEDAGDANPDAGFRYDPTLGGTGGYIYNLKTTGLDTGTYALIFQAEADPTTHRVVFQIR